MDKTGLTYLYQLNHFSPEGVLQAITYRGESMPLDDEHIKKLGGDSIEIRLMVFDKNIPGGIKGLNDLFKESSHERGLMSMTIEGENITEELLNEGLSTKKYGLWDLVMDGTIGSGYVLKKEILHIPEVVNYLGQ